MANIVFLGHYNGGKDDYDIRHYFFARALLKNSHNISIINGAFSHRLAFPEVLKNKLKIHNDSGIKFISVKTPKYKGNAIARIRNIFAFVINVILSSRQIIKETGKIDIIVMSSPHLFQFYAAKYLAKKNKAKLIIDIKDIWPLAMTEVGVSKYHPFIIFSKITEKIMYKNSDCIISPLQNLQQYFDDNNYNYKANWIPTGIETEFYDKIKCPKKRYFPENKFIIGYIGGINSDNAIKFLLDTAIELQNIDDILVVVVGKGGYEDYYKNKYKGCANILFFDSVPKNDVFCMMKECDVLYKGLLPNKIFTYGTFQTKQNEYMYSGRPVLHVFDFPDSDLIQKSGCGLVSKFGDLESLKLNIMKFYNMSIEDRKKIGNNGKEYILENMKSDKITKELEKIFTI